MNTTLELGGQHNFRDLGGVPLAGGQQTRAGALARSCALRDAPAQWLELLQERAPVSIIDLRSTAEITSQPGPMTSWPVHTNIPLFEKLAPLTTMLSDNPDMSLSERYIAALDNAADAFVKVFTTIARAPEGLVVFHCTAGKDRTGLIAALMLDMLGAAPDAIANDYAETARFAPDLLRRLRSDALARGSNPALVSRILTAEAEDMLRFLAHLKQHHGSAESYLLACGLQRPEIESIKARHVV